jgi:hypothetical protein
VAPAAGGLLVKPPEITTFRPAVDGSGDDAIVSPPVVHGATQQVVCAQQVLDEAGQQFVGTGQHGTMCGLLFAALVGSGQQGMTPDCWGQMWGTLPAAPAGLSNARAHNGAARKTSDDGRIRRRIADNRATGYPDL